MNGTESKTQVEQENGKWFWVITDLNSGNNTIKCDFNFGFKITGKTEVYVLSDQGLEEKAVKSLTMNENELLPAKPYPPNIQKDIVPVSNYAIK